MVGLALALALDAGTFLLTRMLSPTDLAIALLPLWAACGGLVAGRWNSRPAPVPGFAVGLIVVATQIGLAAGYLPELGVYIEPGLTLLQVIAAITGGLIGTLLARRADEPAARAEPEYPALS
jgi:hypothetical protein